MRSFNFFRRHRNSQNTSTYRSSSVFYTIASLAAFAAINYTIIHSPIVLLATLGLLVHELAHYFYAKAYGAKTNFPIFLPLPLIAIAFVKVKDLKLQHKPFVAISGMVFASLMYLFVSLFNFYHLFYISYIPFLFIFFEILLNIIGSDGMKFRSAKMKMAA